MTRILADARPAGPLGPVAVSAGAVLLLAGPLMRGGMRAGPGLVLVLIALFVLAAMVLEARLAGRSPWPDASADSRLVALVLASPLLIALVQLTPLPASWWAVLPGHEPFAASLHESGLDDGRWRPLTLSPDLTRASLLGALPLVAALLLGWLSSLRQLRALVRVVAALAFFEVGFGLLQVAGGMHSPLYMGMMTYGSPIGTLATRNLYANFLALALAGYLWLAYDAIRYSANRHAPPPSRRGGGFSAKHATAAWAAGGAALLVGALMSRSRAGAAMAIGVGVLGVAICALRIFGRNRGWRFALPLAVGVLAVAAWTVGLDNVTERLGGGQLAGSAGFRGDLARSSVVAGAAFFPWGSGWGTYELAYPRFQPASIAYTIDYAHMDYAQLFVEGGALFMAVAGLVAFLIARRAGQLVRAAIRDRRLGREAMACVLCGVGVLAFLLHAAVDFPMRIPANSVLAAFLFGAFMRPLQDAEGNGFQQSRISEFP